MQTLLIFSPDYPPLYRLTLCYELQSLTKPFRFVHVYKRNLLFFANGTRVKFLRGSFRKLRNKDEKITRKLFRLLKHIQMLNFPLSYFSKLVRCILKQLSFIPTGQSNDFIKGIGNGVFSGPFSI